MDFDMPADDDPRRLAVRAWLDEHPEPTNATLHERGYIVPHWPAPYGLDADPMHQLIIDEELKRAGVTTTSVATNAIGVGWAAPTIYLAGSDWQKERFLEPIFTGEEVWSQLFSEPDSGSDLASLGTRAVRDGDEYLINGSKIWSSGAHHSKFGILIARTNPDVPKHKGISYFIVPMDLPGIELTPIVDMTTAYSFNQTFFNDVRLPAKYLVGEEGDGWKLAKVTLANERVSLSAAGSMWGTGPTAGHLLDLVRRAGGVSDPIERQRFAALHIESEVLRLGRLRTLSARLQGTHGMIAGSGPVGSLPSGAQTGATEINFPRGEGEYPDVDPVWHYGFLFAPALTVGGGTFAVQRTIIAEQVLGLPRDINVEQGLSWSESRRQR